MPAESWLSEIALAGLVLWQVLGMKEMQSGLTASLSVFIWRPEKHIWEEDGKMRRRHSWEEEPEDLRCAKGAICMGAWGSIYLQSGLTGNALPGTAEVRVEQHPARLDRLLP